MTKMTRAKKHELQRKITRREKRAYKRLAVAVIRAVCREMIDDYLASSVIGAVTRSSRRG